MPRIPTFTDQSQLQVPGVQRADPGAFAAPFVALAQGAQQVQRVALHQLEVQRALNTEQMKLDIDQKLAELKTSWTETTARVEAEGLPGKDYAPRMREEFKTLREQAEGGLMFPGSASLFRRKAALLGEALQQDAINRGTKLQHGEILGLATLQQQEDVNTVVSGTPAPGAGGPLQGPTRTGTSLEVEQAFRRALARPLGLFRSGVIGQEKYDAMQIQTFRDITLGAISRDADNPRLANPNKPEEGSVSDRTLRLLDAGAYPHLTAKEQGDLAHTLRSRIVAREEKATREFEKKAEADRDAYVADFEDRIDEAKRAGETMTPFRQELSQAIQLRRIKRAEVNHLTTLLDKEPREAPSDPSVRLNVESNVHGTTPQWTERDIRSMMADHVAGLPGLNRQDGIALIDRLRQDAQRRDDKALTEEKFQYDKAYSQLRLELGFTSPLDFGSTEQHKRILADASRAFNALNSRTNPRGALTPEQALAQVVPIYQKAQTDSARFSVRDAIKTADPKFFATPPPPIDDEKAFTEWTFQTAQYIDRLPEKTTNPRYWKMQRDRLTQIVADHQEFLTRRQRQQDAAPRYWTPPKSSGAAPTQRPTGRVE